MRVEDLVLFYDEALPPALCTALAEHVDRHRSGGFDADYRRCAEAKIDESFPLFGKLVCRLSSMLRRYKEDVDDDGSALSFVGRAEQPLVFRYDVDPERPNRFHAHTDAWSMDTASRVVSLIAYLNDVEEGGETRFEFQTDDMSGRRSVVKVKPKAGRILMFPSSFLYPHEALAPRSGPKYVLVSWYHFAGEGHRVKTILV